MRRRPAWAGGSAADLEDGADRLPLQEGATDALHHATPSLAGQCDGPYKVQLDRVGETLIVDLERRNGRAVITGVR